jgi:large subunit ribosomal protein L22
VLNNILTVFLSTFEIFYLVNMKNLENINAYAFSRYVRISPSKIRRVLNQLKGRSCNEALIILKFMPYKACPIISKVISSAVANAKSTSNVELKEGSLFIIEARVDSGPVLKRFCPHAQGRGFPIKKRTSHIISLI